MPERRVVNQANGPMPQAEGWKANAANVAENYLLPPVAAVASIFNNKDVT